MEGEELVEAGRVAEDTFIRQMRRRRMALDLSQSDLAERAVALGGNLYQQTIAKLEAGQRALKLSEADILAKALGTTVQDMLASAFSGDAPPAMRKPPTLEELRAQAMAAERRLEAATEEATRAALAAKEAKAHALVAEMNFERATMRQRDVQQEYHYLLEQVALAERGQGPDAETTDTPPHEDHVTLGQKLASARLNAGMSVLELSKRTKIRPSIIEAMERGDFSPCGERSMYVNGHIRTYARAVGVDPDPLLKQWRSASG
ncbi:helix-turn-helix domain-containing protein [Streptomyces javensis]|uniref:helix-turn-helix domain-containing protein n=1 Tax=Streptomyces javensis TaxID=114698 RepID=UPI0031F9B0FC